MAAEVMGRMFHMSLGAAQRCERFTNLRMRLRRSGSAGLVGSAFTAGVARGLALWGAAGAVAINANARIKDARPRRLAILVFMNHSSRPNIGSDRRIVPLLSIRIQRQ